MTPNHNPTLNPGNDRFTYCPFTKHKGIRWIEVVQDDVQYVEWLLDSEDADVDDSMHEFLTNLLEDYYSGSLDI